MDGSSGTDADDAGAASQPSNDVGLFGSLDELSQLVMRPSGLSDTLTQIAEFAVKAIPGAEGAGLTLFQGDRPDTVVASEQFVHEVDALQYRIGEGPCITAAAERKTVRAGSVSEDARFPGFGPLVAELGVHSMLSLPLLSDEQVLGSINVYARAKEAFDRRAEELGELFAVPAAISVRNAQALSQSQLLVERLQVALTKQASLDRESGARLHRAVAERESADLAASAARTRAEVAVSAKDALMSRMSHELRTPLNEVLGFAQLLETDVLTAGQRESVAHILHGGRHLLKMIDDILDITGENPADFELTFEPVLIGDVLSTTIALVRPLATAARVTLSYDLVLPPDARYVWANRVSLEQVMMNLLSNAVKFNQPEGRVEVRCELLAGSHLAVRVIDSGPGIAAADLPRLFVPFDRLEATSATEGSGIGLALSERLVTKMGGRLDVESIPGWGSTFTVTLPITASPRTHHRAEQQNTCD